MLEKNFQKKCAATAKAEGWLVFKMAATGFRGFPDLLMVAPVRGEAAPGSARIVLVELKNPNNTGKLRELQRWMIGQLLTRGVEVYVCSSEESFRKILDGGFHA